MDILSISIWFFIRVFFFVSLPLIAFSLTLSLILKNNRLKGKITESVTFDILKELDSSEYKILNNVTLKIDGRMSQIDHIVVSVYGIFVIETKYRAGSIYGDSRKPYLTQYIKGKKFSLRNPFHQNYGHVQCLKRVLSDFPDLEPVSIVAFSGDTVKKIHMDSSIRIRQVCDEIKKYREPILSIEDRDRIFKELKVLKKEGDSKKMKKEHINYVRGVKEERRVNSV